jgi:hypothetical protein
MTGSGIRRTIRRRAFTVPPRGETDEITASKWEDLRIKSRDFTVMEDVS